MAGQGLLQLIQAVFDLVGIVCGMGKDVFAFGFKKQDLIEGEKELLIFFVEGDFGAGG